MKNEKFKKKVISTEDERRIVHKARTENESKWRDLRNKNQH